MKITLIKHHGTLIPETEIDFESISKIKEGESYVFNASRVRSPERHREFFGCLNLVFKNLPENSDVEDLDELLYYVKMLIVKHDWEKGIEDSLGGRINRKGNFIPRSVKWDKMNEDEFEKWRNRAYPIIAKMIGLTAGELLAEYSGNDIYLKQ